MNLSEDSKSIKVVAYIRIKGKVNITSQKCLETQQQSINGSAEKLGLDIVKWFVQVGGTTDKMKNLDLFKLVDFATKNNIKHVVINSYNRISRNSNDLDWWVSYFDKNEIKIVTPHTESLKIESSEEIFLKAITEAMARYSSSLRSDSIKRSIKLRKQLQADN